MSDLPPDEVLAATSRQQPRRRSGDPPPPPLAVILDRLDAFFARFVAFPRVEARWAVVLWVAHTHTIAAFESTPRLALLSPEMRSGKTRTLEVAELVVPDPLFTVNVSPAALFRIVDQRQPTLLLDEADTYLGPNVAKQHEDLRGLINAGHRRGAVAVRGQATGRSVEVVEFRAFAACALAGIGDLPATVLDRAVIVPMKRRAPNERIEPFRLRQARADAAEVFTPLCRWGIGNVERLATLWPVMPDGIADRAADVWEPLVAIADLAGEHWPLQARQACLILEGQRQKRDPTLAVQLLADCKRVLDGRDRITSVELVAALVALDDAPWGDLRGKPIEARGVANYLRRFDVRPDAHRFDGAVAKGYLATDFHDAWLRYIPDAVTDVTELTVPSGGGESVAPPLDLAWPNQPNGEQEAGG